MNRWKGKIAVVTGASSGIGAAITKDLVRGGLTVIGLARRVERVERLIEDLTEAEGKLYAYKCDVTDLESIKATFSWIENTFSHLHILVNNAGVLKHTRILSHDNEEDLKSVIDTNFTGAIFCIKEAVKLMKKSEEECHVININSVLGHTLPSSSGAFKLNLYPATKFALRTASEVVRQEMTGDRHFRISNISPGLVKTDIVDSMKSHDERKFIETQPALDPEDISQTILFVLSAPKHVQIAEVIVKPVGQVI